MKALFIVALLVSPASFAAKTTGGAFKASASFSRGADNFMQTSASYGANNAHDGKACPQMTKLGLNYNSNPVRSRSGNGYGGRAIKE